MILSVISYYFLKQRYPVDLCNGEVSCSLWGTDWILKYCLDALRLQRVKILYSVLETHFLRRQLTAGSNMIDVKCFRSGYICRHDTNNSLLMVCVGFPYCRSSLPVPRPTRFSVSKDVRRTFFVNYCYITTFVSDVCPLGNYAVWTLGCIPTTFRMNVLLPLSGLKASPPLDPQMWRAIFCFWARQCGTLPVIVNQTVVIIDRCSWI
jgi:hypothetical protein